ncbi:hypothetical protein HWV62_21366 [Athelia sp. TMB]|nr:hypothetical protein HWV62_21366 [Athelia sp. TMB]
MSDISTPSTSYSSSSSREYTPPRTPPILHQNTIDPSARWLVQKFGGTSVGKFAVKIAEDIVSSYIDQHKVAIVCSARSGSTKALGTTNLLLQAASEALRRPEKKSVTSGIVTPVNGLFRAMSFSDNTPAFGSSPRGRGSSSPRSSPPASYTPLTVPQPGQSVPAFNATVDLIRSEHMTAAKSHVRDPVLLAELEDEIEADCDWLRGFLFAAQFIDEISPRSKDTIIGLGERMSCKMMTAVLRDQGIDAEYVSLEDIVPDNDDGDDSAALDQAFYDRLAAALGERIAQCGPRVPVVTGFFGHVPGSLLRQIGRGYTDLLSSILAVGLDASELQIWKEVDGIFTADPRKVPTARLIPIISPDEAAELTYYGSEVVHPLTMEQAIRKRISIRIKNVMNPRGGGTVIHPDPDVDSQDVDEELGENGVPEPVSDSMLRQIAEAAMAQEDRRQRTPTAVTIKERIMVLNVKSNRKNVSHGFFASVFGTLDRFGVVVDLISTSEVHVSMAIEDNLHKKLLHRLVVDLEKYGTVSVHTDMSILSLVGKLKNMVGIAGRMFSTLANGSVNIEMISQGSSEINISCVIEGRDAVKALNLIHQSCLQITPDNTKSRVGPWLF